VNLLYTLWCIDRGFIAWLTQEQAEEFLKGQSSYTADRLSMQDLSMGPVTYAGCIKVGLLPQNPFTPDEITAALAPLGVG
jgi:hypothetical protein